MCCFVEALNSSHTLQSLFLESNCKFEDDAMSHLIRSKLVPQGLVHGVFVMNANSIDFLADALIWRPQDRQHSIGSSLRELYLCTRERVLYPTSELDVVAFLDYFGTNATMIHLKVLTLEAIHTVSGEALVRCLLKLVHLRELMIMFVWGHEAQGKYDRLFETIKLNGSLHKVGIGRVNTRLLGRECLRRRLPSYRKRNLELPKLLSKAATTGIPDGPPGVPEEHGSLGAKNTSTSVFLYPLLFCASQQARRMAPTNFLSGLLSLSHSINPQEQRSDPLYLTLA
jgi:hypothetical protein